MKDARDAIRSLGQEDILEEKIILAWKTPLFFFWKMPSTEEPEAAVHEATNSRTQLSEWALCESESHSGVSSSLWPHGWTMQSMDFSRPEHWSGEPFPSPGDLPNSWVEIQVSRSAGGFFTS